MITIGDLYRGQVPRVPLRAGWQHSFREKTISTDFEDIDGVVDGHPGHCLAVGTF